MSVPDSCEAEHSDREKGAATQIQYSKNPCTVKKHRFLLAESDFPQLSSYPHLLSLTS